MGWLLFAVLCMMWTAFLLPGRRTSPGRSVEEFERRMELLAGTDRNEQGRWIVTPRKGMAFIGRRERAKERARERRRRVFVFMLETIGLTALIGIVPPLRAMWYASAALVALLGVYVWLLVSLKGRSAEARSFARARADAQAEPARPTRQRYAADAGGRVARPAFNGLTSLGADDLATIVVRPTGRQVGVARV